MSETTPAADAPSPGVLDVIAQRRSPSVFDPTFDVPDDAVATLFDAARWAPTWGNTQPFRFIAGRRHGDAWDDVFSAVVETLSRGNRRWAPAASMLVVSLEQVAALPGASKPFADERTVGHDVGQAAAYLTLQAHSMGLAGHQFAGFDRERFAEIVDIGPEWRVMAGIAIGRAWPDAERDTEAPAVVRLRERVPEYDLPGSIERETKPRRRRPLDEVVTFAADRALDE